MVKSETIFVRPFNVEVRVLIGETIEECQNYWDKNMTPLYDEGLFEKYSNANGMSITMIRDGFPYHSLILLTEIDLDVIVHECFHLIMGIANMKGCKWSHKSDEFYAYMIQDTFGQIYKIWTQ